mmetsp:Transcript_25740/g.41345  ORF Transcript_25740/g.41345 Transcript_25740/m.41345 type:complete len:215 (+) Transcript_25740:690-1334(+)
MNPWNISVHKDPNNDGEEHIRVDIHGFPPLVSLRITIIILLAVAVGSILVASDLGGSRIVGLLRGRRKKGGEHIGLSLVQSVSLCLFSDSRNRLQQTTQRICGTARRLNTGENADRFGINLEQEPTVLLPVFVFVVAAAAADEDVVTVVFAATATIFPTTSSRPCSLSTLAAIVVALGAKLGQNTELGRCCHVPRPPNKLTETHICINFVLFLR